MVLVPGTVGPSGRGAPPASGGRGTHLTTRGRGSTTRGAPPSLNGRGRGGTVSSRGRGGNGRGSGKIYSFFSTSKLDLFFLLPLYIPRLAPVDQNRESKPRQGLRLLELHLQSIKFCTFFLPGFSVKIL